MLFMKEHDDEAVNLGMTYFRTNPSNTLYLVCNIWYLYALNIYKVASTKYW